jgi:hypothetical protein
MLDGRLRPLQVELAQFPCCGWFALKLAMSGEHMTTTAELRALEETLSTPETFRHENGLLAGMRLREFPRIAKCFGYQLRKLPSNETPLRAFLAMLQGSPACEPHSRFVLMVSTNVVNTQHAICVRKDAENRISLTDQGASVHLEKMHSHRHFSKWTSCLVFELHEVLPALEHPERRARALAQAAVREEARATRLEGALRDARPRLAAAIARKWGENNMRSVLANKRGAAKQARRAARLAQVHAERAGVAFKPRRRARRSARTAEGATEGVAPRNSAARGPRPLEPDLPRTGLAVAQKRAAWERARAR